MSSIPPSVRRGAKLVVTLAVVLAVVASLVVAFPPVVGADHTYVVTSGSMSPTIRAGDVVVVAERPASAVEEGDVITYSRFGDRRVTHRVVGVETVDGDRQFRTKGDGNEDPDPQPVPAEDLIGEVVFFIPLFGYVVRFSGTPVGRIALVVVPSLLLVGNELLTMARGARHEDRGGEPEDPTATDDGFVYDVVEDSGRPRDTTEGVES